MKPSKPTNVRMHLTGGFIAGFVVMIILFNINLAWRVMAGWLMMIAWFGVTLGWELWQYCKSNDNSYWRRKWLDTLLDMIAGNAPAIVMILAGMFGNRF